MREEIRDKGRLSHILSAIEVLLSGRDDINLLQMKDNPIVFFGFVKNVEIIGEAVYMLSKGFKESHTEVDWNGISKMRHVLVHGYYKISQEQLWNTINNDIPALKPWIESYYKELDEEGKAKGSI